MVKVRKDLTGRVFGKLTVIKQVDDYITPKGKHHAQWLCECSCAEHNRVVVIQNNLVKGKTASCGCLNKNNSNMVRVKEDLTGRIFGRLTVIKQVEDYITSKGEHKAQWLCECNCELHSQVIVLGYNLKNGHTQSCGCLNCVKSRVINKKCNRSDLSGDYGIIWCINTNKPIYFDLEDADNILKHSWSIDSNGYPSATINGETVRMHVFLGCKWHDHHNRNKLDNRRVNLIYCTQQENVRNSSIGKNNQSGFIGVYWSNQNNGWVSQITMNKKTIYIGTFNDKQDAVISRLQAELNYYGEFAPQRHLFKEYGITPKEVRDEDY
jgi:hypothetical protein